MAFNREDDEQDELQRQMMGEPMALAEPPMGAASPVAPPSALKVPQVPGVPKPTGPVNVAQAGADRGVAPPSAVGGGVEPMAPPPGGDRAALAKSAAAAGYKDIGDTNPLTTGAHMGNLEGFNTGGWGSGERGSGTMKNKFGQIASRYDPTQPGSAKALMQDEDFRAYWPDAQMVEHANADLIDFDGPGGQPPVDVLRAARAGGAGEAWTWQPTGGAEGGGAAGGGGGVNGLMNGDPMADINAQIDALMSGQDGDEQNMIQQLLKEMA